MSFEIVYGDITAMETDAIVNAANKWLAPGGGVCGAIFAAADSAALEEECQKIGGCETGSAVITPVKGLHARYVIHAVGPIWQGGNYDEEKLLRGCYRRSLELCDENGLGSVAFPLISAGIYGYPREEAMAVAESEVNAYLEEKNSGLKVYLVLFG